MNQGKVGQNVLLNAVGEELVFLVIAHVGERQDCDRLVIELRGRLRGRRRRCLSLDRDSGKRRPPGNREIGDCYDGDPGSNAPCPARDPSPSRRFGRPAALDRAGAPAVVTEISRPLEQPLHMLDELLRRKRSWHARPLHAVKLGGHGGGGARGVVHHDGHQIRRTLHQEVRLLNGQLPLEPEIALAAPLHVPGNDRDEKRAGINLLSDLLVPGIAAPELILVKPNLDAVAAQRLGDATGGRGILTRVAEKYRATFRRWRTSRHVSVGAAGWRSYHSSDEHKSVAPRRIGRANGLRKACREKRIE